MLLSSNSRQVVQYRFQVHDKATLIWEFVMHKLDKAVQPLGLLFELCVTCGQTGIAAELQLPDLLSKLL